MQLLEAAQHLGDRQAELRAVAAGTLPAAAATGGELDAHADLRPDADLLGVLQDQPELGVFLDDRDDRAPDLLGQHRHLDELGVLEAVADDRGVVVGLRRDGQELGLRAGLEAEPVLAAEIEHFLDDLPLLVDLDRVDAHVAAFVLVLRDGRLEGVVDVADAVPEDVAEPDEHGQLDAAQHQMIGELLEVDRLGGVLGRMDQHVTRGRDGEVALPPAVDFVEFGRVADGESLARLPVTVGANDRCAHEHMIQSESRASLGNCRARGVAGGDGGNGITTEELKERSGRRSPTDRHDGWSVTSVQRGQHEASDRFAAALQDSGSVVLRQHATCWRRVTPPVGRTDGRRRLLRRLRSRIRCDPVPSGTLPGPRKPKDFYCPFSRDRVTRPWDERPSRAGRNAVDRGRGRAAMRSKPADFTSNFGPQTHDSTRRNPHFIRLTPSTVPQHGRRPARYLKRACSGTRDRL